MSPRKPGPRLHCTVAGATLLGLCLPAPVRALVTQAIPADVQFQLVASLEELVTLSVSMSAPVLIYSLPTAPTETAHDTHSLRDVLKIHEALGGELRSLPAAALCSGTSVDARLVTSLRALNHVHLLTLDAPNPSRQLWHALERLLAARISAALSSAIGDIDSSLIRRVMIVALYRAAQGMHVADIAKALHMHERTLRRRLRAEAGSITVQDLIGWSRILLVAWHLRERERPVVDIANALSFSAASNLHRTVRDYTGISIRALRASDPVTMVTQAFQEAVRGGAVQSVRADEDGGPASFGSTA